MLARTLPPPSRPEGHWLFSFGRRESFLASSGYPNGTGDLAIDAKPAGAWLLENHQMGSSQFSRRDFSQLTMAAIGGLCMGAGTPGPQDTKQDSKEAKVAISVDPALLLKDEPNVCRGLNTCKTRGKGKHD